MLVLNSPQAGRVSRSSSVGGERGGGLTVGVAVGAFFALVFVFCCVTVLVLNSTSPCYTILQVHDIIL